MCESECCDDTVPACITPHTCSATNFFPISQNLLPREAPDQRVQVRRAIARLLTPSLQSKEFVHTELLRIAGQCAPSDIARFPALQVRP